ncbi:hypothetical protein Kpol_385p6 [Vanderwaltozyma polyspora DSM 70294]|uniref:RanBD1 domain-containing protein n=1 Tax=Vanderwaltozyma polyspora (strain ATCC 22028 / DSM 70294 / BCRC 21397 / CBS 2163 / NBRC 10782 / NRRL Y-8283 / UCD 57-17) TaxID=436907 RepID=A7TS18_VANPO|nr:uncharacterized protein Kpol_385p6 [Vanderwaltozyma polyspora DSM 70294]EDO14937.1 hypothetical protein Kpol_385p6 [Vanderwaltozyma polyspora DSM 70294]
MSKRNAGAQITREAFELEGNSDDDETPKSFSMASSEVMSRRKIAMPKRKMAFKLPTNNTDESKMAGAFNFSKKEDNKNEIDDSSAKLKALNNQFSLKVSQSISNDPFVDLSVLFDKYKEYLKSIKNTSPVTAGKPAGTPLQKPAFGTAPVSVPISAPAPVPAPVPAFNNLKRTAEEENEEESSSSSDEDEVKKDIKVQGPQFTLQSKPISKDSVFAFGSELAKKVQEDADSDSESEVEIKGPQFTFSGAVKSDVFKLEEKEGKKETDRSQPVISFKKPDVGEQSKLSNPPTTSSDNKTPSFAFNTKPADSIEKKEEEISKPNFAFNVKPTEDKKNEAEAVKVSFAPSSSSSSNNENNEKKPTFVFGNNSNNATQSTSKPTLNFSFGAASTATEGTKPSGGFMFGGMKTEEKKKEEKKEEDKSKPSGGFMFGVQTPKDTTKSEITETNKPEEVEKPKPAFNFGGIKSSDADSNNKSKPAFAFGSSISTSAPSFSFEKPASATSASTTATSAFSFPGNSEKPAVPSGGFKFSLPFEQKSGNDEAKTTAASTISTTESTTTETGHENNEASAEGEGSSGINMQNGEEDETVLFTQKAKLMTFNTETKSYDSKGVGEMKVLQKTDDKSKVRLLCRSDGMGNVLLNSSVVKSFSFTPLAPEKDNLVKTPTIDSDGKLVTYIVKFKQKADGRLFIKSIDEAKKDM